MEQQRELKAIGFKIEAGIWKRLRIRSIEEGVTMQVLVQRMLERCLEALEEVK